MYWVARLPPQCGRHISIAPRGIGLVGVARITQDKYYVQEGGREKADQCGQGKVMKNTENFADVIKIFP